MNMSELNKAISIFTTKLECCKPCDKGPEYKRCQACLNGKLADQKEGSGPIIDLEYEIRYGHHKEK